MTKESSTQSVLKSVQQESHQKSNRLSTSSGLLLVEVVQQLILLVPHVGRQML